MQGDIDINANAACGTTTGVTVDMVGCYDPTFHADQSAAGVVARLGGVSYTGLALRCGAPGSGNGYWWVGTPGFAEVGTLTGGVFAVLGTTSAFVAGDVLEFIAQGTDILCYINGVLDTSFVDATYATGVPGVAAFRNDKASGMANLTVRNLVPDAGLWPLFVR